MWTTLAVGFLRLELMALSIAGVVAASSASSSESSASRSGGGRPHAPGRTFPTEFVTVRRSSSSNSSWTAVETDAVRERDEELLLAAAGPPGSPDDADDDDDDGYGYGDYVDDRAEDLGFLGRYQLRFRPVEPVKHLFWHKWYQQEQQTETETEPDEPPEEPPEEPTVAPTEPVPTETATTAGPAPTAAMRPRPTTTRRPSTTVGTTIMRPHPVPPQLGSSLKNLLLFGSPLQANIIQEQAAGVASPGSASKGKGFLSLFEVIKFENTQCFVAMGDIRTMEGVCYHEFECKSLGGIPTERCGAGVGVCCIFLAGCGEATNQPVVYFESPNYPNAVREMMICVLTVNLRPRAQQLRLDFLMFELNRPTDGDCIDDQFVVSGQNANYAVPVLCGINTGQHIYIDVENSLDRRIYLSFFAKVPNGARSFNIKVAQLERDLAPLGCLQYFSESAGVVKSFNYDLEGTVTDNREATYLNNLNYAICMRRSKDSCAVTYTVEPQSGDQLDFQIVNKDEAENDIVSDGQAGAGIFNCPDDYVAVNQVRLCGDRFNDGSDSNSDFSMSATVRDVAGGPIVLPFRSDGEYVGRGFRFAYRQELCE